MRLLTSALLAVTLSAFAYAQQGNPVVIRAEDGRWTTANRQLSATDVPPTSALFGIIVTDAPEGRSAIVSSVSV